MENTYVIAWKSADEPRRGQGKKLLSREEAIALSDELNRDYPAFVHEPLNLAPADPATAATVSAAVEVEKEEISGKIIAFDKIEPASETRTAAIPDEAVAVNI